MQPMANVNPVTKPKAFTLRADDEFLDAIERVRALTRPIPSKSEAVRAALMEKLDRLEKQSRAADRRKED